MLLSKKNFDIESIKDLPEFQDIYDKYKKIENQRKTVWFDCDAFQKEVRYRLLDLSNDKNYCHGITIKRENDMILNQLKVKRI